MGVSQKTNICPRCNQLIEPVYQAIVSLGGSASTNEIRNTVISNLNLPDAVAEAQHHGGYGGNELDYNLAWAKTTLKNYGAITNTTRGVWHITPEFKDIQNINVEEAIKTYRAYISEKQKKNKHKQTENSEQVEDLEQSEPWRTELMRILLDMDPYGFERLVQRLLRESGFTKVKVTKKSGDGGLDGFGVFCINGLLSFNVAFQCKRYSNSVSASEIRDFRGSLTADIEKGLFITTGTFTQTAVKEASVAGKQKIDLVDGENFMDMLLERHLGVYEKTVYEVDEQFFSEI